MERKEFTGERPGWGRDFDYDEARHLAAYLYASELAGGKRVLDAGCGEGFGTQALAEVAAEVVGVDYSQAAVDSARRHWTHPRLRFERRDLAHPADLSSSFDLVVNFQVLEHIEDDVAFVEQLRSFLAPGGTLLLTTPNRLTSFSENPYHLREYTAAELETLLASAFGDVSIVGMRGNDKVTRFDLAREKAVKRILRLDPLGLRKVLPDAVVKRVFASLAVVVRRQARNSAHDGPSEQIAPADFYVSDADVDASLDLVAVCKCNP